MQEVDLALLLRKGRGLGTLSHNFCSLLAVQARPVPALLCCTERMHALVPHQASRVGMPPWWHPACCAGVPMCHAHAKLMSVKCMCMSVGGHQS